MNIYYDSLNDKNNNDNKVYSSRAVDLGEGLRAEKVDSDLQSVRGGDLRGNHLSNTTCLTLLVSNVANNVAHYGDP